MGLGGLEVKLDRDVYRVPTDLESQEINLVRQFC